MVNMKYYLGFDIGGTKTALSLGQLNGKNLSIVYREEVKTTKDPKETLNPLIKKAKELKKEYQIESIGISCGGPLDEQKGIILTTPNLPGWHSFYIVDFIKEELGLPTKIMNDANACALAEYHFGASKGFHNVIFITCGTGFGAGLVLNDQLYSGTNGNAGEIGHVRIDKKGPLAYGKNGCVESFCSGAGIAKLAIEMANKEKELPFIINEMGGLDKVTTKKLAEAAHNGDAFAKKVFSRSGKMLGKTLAILVDLFNPERIVIGGVYMRASDLLIRSMKKELKKEALPESLKVCKVVPAKLQEEIGDYAAISVAM